MIAHLAELLPLWRPFALGLCSFTVLVALLRNISQQDADVLPEPDELCVAKGEPMLTVQVAVWEFGPGHGRYPEDCQ